MNHKCARVGCGVRCRMPSWKYCSDDCRRLAMNKRAVDKRHKKLVKDKSK